MAGAWARICLGMVALACLCGPAAAAECRRPKNVPAEPKVVVRTAFPEVHYRRDLSRAQLTARSTKGAAANGRLRTLGLTESTFATGGGRFDLRYMPGKDGYCHWLDTIEVELAVTGVTVFVASEYAPGTCEDRAVLDHEHEHVRINREVLQRFAPKLRAAIEAEARRISPFVSHQASDTDFAKRILAKVSQEVVQRMSAERDRANAAIDDDASYQETQRRCRNW